MMLAVKASVQSLQPWFELTFSTALNTPYCRHLEGRIRMSHSSALMLQLGLYKNSILSCSRKGAKSPGSAVYADSSEMF